MFRLWVLLFLYISAIHTAKHSKMSSTELHECYEKSKDLNTGCDFLKCFHERYNCNDESVTAWAYELCQAFPKEIILQFTPMGKQMMINIQNCTQDFLAKTFRQRKKLNCHGFESKYFSTLEKCYENEKDFCQVFKDNRQLFMKQATTIMFKKPRALQVFSAAGKNCTRMNY